MSWGRRPAQAGHRAAPGPEQILELFAYGPAVAQVVMLGQQLSPESLRWVAAHLFQAQRSQLRQAGYQWTLIHRFVVCARPSMSDDVIGYPFSFGRQLDPAGPMQRQQQAPTHHVAQSAVGLDPVPGPA